MKSVVIALTLILFCGSATAQPHYSGVYGVSPHCQGCHAQAIPPLNQFSPWHGTPHACAYDSLPAAAKSNPVCLSCHTTGWDLSLNNSGFDDYFYTGDSLGMDRMRNVQCESCHGPTQYPHLASTVVDYHAEICGDCHTGMGRPVYDEWAVGPHGLSAPPQAQNIACAKCHEARSVFVYHSTGTPPSVLPDQPVWQTTCAVCHATHTRNAGIAQLFLSPDSTCRACHNMDGATVGQVPHATQQNMIRGVGYGAYEWPGYTYANSCHQCMVPGTCFTCHMDTITCLEPSTGHTVQPHIQTCIVCHSVYVPPDSSFNFFGVQSEIDSLLAVLAAALAQADTTTIEYARAKFDYEFVVNDGSRGIHNSFYAEGLLISSIQNLPNAARNPNFGQPAVFTLHSPRPNPFNAATEVSFDLHSPSLVKLTVWNTAGELVKVLASEWKPQGRHEVIFEGNEWAGGIYLLRLEAGGLTSTVKVVLLK